MAGMMVSGVNPIYASIHEFVIVTMILAATGITGVAATALARLDVHASRSIGASPRRR
jgi:ABC-type iron transport system FetAB permease component